MKKIKETIISLTALALSACSSATQAPNQEPMTQAPEETPAEQTSEPPTEPPKEPEKTPDNPPEKPKDKVIGSGKTPLMDNNENRTTNLSLAIKAINGKTLEPGEIFSFNDIVGVRSSEKGYQKAIAFDANNNKVKEYGGGVCQISTTAYLAAVNSGFEIVERHKHTREVPYEKNGNDATVSFGSADLKFKNNKASAVKINASMDKNAVCVTIVSL